METNEPRYCTKLIKYNVVAGLLFSLVQSTNVTSALEIFLNYALCKSTCYLLTTNRLLTLFSLRYFLLGDALSSVGLYSNEVAV